MGLALGMIIMLLIGCIGAAIASMAGIIYVGNRLHRTRYAGIKLGCLTALFVCCVAAVIGLGNMAWVVLNY